MLVEDIKSLQEIGMRRCTPTQFHPSFHKIPSNAEILALTPTLNSSTASHQIRTVQDITVPEGELSLQRIGVTTDHWNCAFLRKHYLARVLRSHGEHITLILKIGSSRKNSSKH